jgi:adenylylsulfate kinase
MTTVGLSHPAFAIWVTGLPASGKSTLVRALRTALEDCGIQIAVLESDALREILTPEPRYDEQERNLFYRQMAEIGALLVDQRVPVVFDATANRSSYRREARSRIPRFMQVYVDSPLAVCVSRDPKGIYRRGREGQSETVPGIQANYEPPESPDVIVHGDREAAEVAAQRVIAKLIEKGYIHAAPLNSLKSRL